MYSCPKNILVNTDKMFIPSAKNLSITTDFHDLIMKIIDKPLDKPA